MIKTRKDWTGDLSDYLKVGDIVDQEMADYFLNVLPPRCWRHEIIQMGEPYSHVNGRATYLTLLKTVKGWQYRGCCHYGQIDEPKEDKNIMSITWNDVSSRILEINERCHRCEIAGSLARGKSSEHDVDLVIIPKPEFYLYISQFENGGGDKKKWAMIDGIKFDMVLTTEESFGAAKTYYTGNKNYNIMMRKVAKSLGMKLNEYGLYDSMGNKVAGEDELGIFRNLSLEYTLYDERSI